MFQLNKKNFSLFFAHLMIILLFSGCQQPDAQKQNSETEITIETNAVAETEDPILKVRTFEELPSILSQKESGNPITAPVQPAAYTYFNGLGTDFIDVNSPIGIYSYVTIHGLKNKNVEDKINKLIYDSTINLLEKDLPPYRGVHSLISNTDIIQNISISPGVMGNAANILSIKITKYITLASSKSNTIPEVYITESDVLNINLKTGELIPLSDLFADNCDYISILNSLVNEYLVKRRMDNGETYSLPLGEVYDRTRLVSPFKGIKKNQKYFVDNWGRIFLLIDYNNPEFETDFIETEIVIYPYSSTMQQNFVLHYRFETWDDSLYDGSIKREKWLLSDHHNPESNIIEQNFTIQEKNLNGYFYSSIPKNIENPLLRADLEGKFEVAKTLYSDFIINLCNQYPNANISLSYVHRVYKSGRYYNESERIDYSIGTYNDKTQIISNVYDSVTGEKVLLQNCFVDGFDYKTAMLNIIKDDTLGINYSSKSDAEILEYISEGAFELSDNCLLLCCGSDEDGIFYYIPYINIGFDNLTIFTNAYILPNRN